MNCAVAFVQPCCCFRLYDVSPPESPGYNSARHLVELTHNHLCVLVCLYLPGATDEGVTTESVSEVYRFPKSRLPVL